LEFARSPRKGFREGGGEKWLGGLRRKRLNDNTNRDMRDTGRNDSHDTETKSRRKMFGYIVRTKKGGMERRRSKKERNPWKEYSVWGIRWK